jgi:hypothetical protein
MPWVGSPTRAAAPLDDQRKRFTDARAHVSGFRHPSPHGISTAWHLAANNAITRSIPRTVASVRYVEKTRTAGLGRTETVKFKYDLTLPARSSLG